MRFVVGCELRRNLVPQSLRYDRFVLPRIALAAMNDLSDVDSIVQQMIEGSS